MGINLQPGKKEKEGRLQTFSGSDGVLLQRRQPALVQVPRKDLCCRSLGPNPDLPQLQQGDCNAKNLNKNKMKVGALLTELEVGEEEESSQVAEVLASIT